MMIWVRERGVLLGSILLGEVDLLHQVQIDLPSCVCVYSCLIEMSKK